MARSWKELVSAIKAGASKEGSGKWEQGDAALEAVPMGDSAAHNGAMEQLQRLAAESGVEVDALRLYRQVSAAWAPATRVAGASWSAHRELMGEPNRAQLIRPQMTVTQARQAHGVSTAGRPEVPRGQDEAEPSDDEQAEQIKRGMRNPQARRKAMADPATRQAASKGISEQYEPRRSDDPRQQLAHPDADQREQTAREGEMFSIRDDLNRAAGLLRLGLHRTLGLDLNESERRFLTPAAREAIDQAGNWKDYLEGQNLDAFLASLEGSEG